MENFQGKKVLVTGGTGFIGDYFVSALIQKGATVFCLTRKALPNKEGVTYLTCDLLNISSEEVGGLRNSIGNIDYVVYLAASIPPITAPKESIITAKENNLDAMLNFLEVFGDLSPTVIFASTVDVYGIPTKESFDESMTIAPNSNYAVAKYCCEKYIEYYCSKNNKEYNILRFSQVYGPHEPLVRVIPIIVDAIFNEKEFTLKDEGGDKRRFLYVEDVASALIAAMETPHNTIYNIAGAEDTSIMDVIKISEGIAGKKLLYKKIPTDQKAVHILPVCEKAFLELNFKPRFSFEEGMGAIIKEINEKRQ
ncbi:MAG: NAD(P)-dependent oxidoreductase [Minisyncoccia bacterium]